MYIKHTSSFPHRLFPTPPLLHTSSSPFPLFPITPLPQGSLHMWVDIFPRQGGTIPPPVNITPRKPEKFFLRIVVWNTMDVELNETSAITGEDMSDIYVKG